MKTLTIKQRNRAYRKALKLIKNDKQIFVCHAIEYQGLFRNRVSPENYPEFFKFKPSNSYTLIGDPWWKSRDKDSRIKALETCIEQTTQPSFWSRFNFIHRLMNNIL